MRLQEEINKIRKLILELSPESAGVEEFFQTIEKYPELIQYLGFEDLESLKDYIDSWTNKDFDELRNEVEVFFKDKKKYIESEINEIRRAADYLNREEGINVSVEELINIFENEPETIIIPLILNKLENTDCVGIEKGQIRKAIDVSTKYQKTNPKDLKKSILSGKYNKPLIVKFSGRYHLVAGNTRLCTVMALGVMPIGIIADLDS
jgi:hypothetical protein